MVGAFGLYISTIVDYSTRHEFDFIYDLGTNVCGAMVPLGTALVVVSVAGCIGACQENFLLLKLVCRLTNLFFWK